MSSPKLAYGQSLFDLASIGNGSAAAGAVAQLKALLAERPGRPLQVIVLEADTEQEQAARMPEYNARVTFPHDLEIPPPGIEHTDITWYDTVAYYSHRARVHKALPRERVALVDVEQLIALAEADLPPQIQLRLHKQVNGGGRPPPSTGRRYLRSRCAGRFPRRSSGR